LLLTGNAKGLLLVVPEGVFGDVIGEVSSTVWMQDALLDQWPNVVPWFVGGVELRQRIGPKFAFFLALDRQRT
jgi:hypothetical protein